MAVISVELDGRPLTFTVPPQEMQGHIMVPMRDLFEALGATVYWYGPTKTITAMKDSTEVVLSLGSTAATVNGIPRVLDVPAQSVNDVTMVPLRFVSETLGSKVTWDDFTQTITITTTSPPVMNSTVAPPTTAVTSPPPASDTTAQNTEATLNTDQPSDSGNNLDTQPADTAVADAPADTPAPAFTSVELDNLLGPIALYPDPLLAQMLPASTFPDQIAVAADYCRNGYRDIDAQPWDVSVQAVAYYPSSVLYRMADNSYRTTAIGQAFLEQPADVTESIQRLRRQARNLGYLVSNRYQVVDDVDGEIRIDPQDAEYIYVPEYDPQVIYMHRGFGIEFSTGLLIGVWLSRDMDWQHHTAYYHGWHGNGWISRSRPLVHVENRHYMTATVMLNRDVRHYDLTNYRDNVRHSGRLPSERQGQKPARSIFRGQVPPVHGRQPAYNGPDKGTATRNDPRTDNGPRGGTAARNDSRNGNVSDNTSHAGTTAGNGARNGNASNNGPRGGTTARSDARNGNAPDNTSHAGSAAGNGARNGNASDNGAVKSTTNKDKDKGRSKDDKGKKNTDKKDKDSK
jgi:hypothetical protein